MNHDTHKKKYTTEMPVGACLRSSSSLLRSQQLFPTPAPILKPDCPLLLTFGRFGRVVVILPEHVTRINH